MYRKKFLPKLVIASLLVGGVNFIPATVNFNADNLQIVSVAYAEVQTVTVNGSAGMSFGDNDEKILNMAKNAARMNAIQAAKEQAGVYIKSYVKTINGVLTDDYIFAYASNNIKIISVNYKKDFYNESDLSGNLTGNVGFKYIATVTVQIDTSDLQNYIRRDEQEKATLAEQAKSSQQNIAEINKNIADLNKTAKNKTSAEIQAEVQKIDNKILAQQKYEEGFELAYQKNYQAAFSKFNETLQLNSNYVEAYIGRGLCYYRLKNYNQALTDLNKAIKLNPNSTNLAMAYNNRGITYFDLQNYSQAIKDFNQAIKLNPNLEQAYYNRGNAYVNLQNYSQAMRDYNQAIKLNPNNADVYYNRGYAYLTLQNYSQAIKDYNQAIKLNPNFARAYALRGTSYLYLQNFKQAISDYNQAIKLNPNDAKSYNDRGIAYLNQRNYNQAIKDFTQAVRLNPNFAMAYDNLGITYRELGDNTQAKKYFAKARQLGWKG